MSFKDAFIQYWKGWLDYSSTTSRSTFWKTFLDWIVIFVLFIGGTCLFARQVNLTRLGLLLTIINLVTFLPNLALLTRRLDDTGIDPRKVRWLVNAIWIIPFAAIILPMINVLDMLVVVFCVFLCLFPTNFFIRK